MTDSDRTRSKTGASDPRAEAGDPRTEDPPPSVGADPSLEAVLRPFRSTRSRGRWLDAVLFHGHGLVRGPLHRFPGRERPRPHPRLLSAAAQEVLRTFRDPVCLEAGCMRAAGEGTESTLSLASVLRGQGRFLCLEEDEGRIESCRRGCGALNQWIEYVPGDPAASLRRLREEGELERIHLAFLHSRGDAEGPWNGYRALDDLLAPGSILIVDDAVRGDAPGRRVTSHLSDRPGWDARIVLVGPGILVAQRRS